MVKTQNTNISPLYNPITFIWINGKTENPYNIKEYAFPYQLLTKYIPLENITKNLTIIEKADITRLMYIYEHGGIYSDLDNQIDYPCLIDLLKDKNGLWFGLEQTREWHNFGSNFFIYSSTKRNEEFLPIFDQIRKRQQFGVAEFTGPGMLRTLNFLNVIDVKSCVKHLFHKTWWGM